MKTGVTLERTLSRKALKGVLSRKAFERALSRKILERATIREGSYKAAQSPSTSVSLNYFHLPLPICLQKTG
jgi:hypothetical protein